MTREQRRPSHRLLFAFLEAAPDGVVTMLRENMAELDPPRDQFRAIAKLILAVADLRDMLQAGGKSSSESHDIVAREILEIGRVLLSPSVRMGRAAEAGLSKRGRDEVDDKFALVELASLILEGEQLKPASRKAAELLAQNDAGASSESVAQRLRTKYRADKLFYLFFAEAKIRFEAVLAGAAPPEINAAEFDRRLLKAAGMELSSN